MRTGVSLSVTSADMDRLRQSGQRPQRAPETRGERRSCCSAPRTSARMRSCARPVNPRPASGAGRSVSPLRALTDLLRDKTRPSRIAKLDPSIAERVVALTMEEPSGETTHWTGAAMAKAVGISASSVRRIWRAWTLPHRVRQPGAVQRPRVRRQPRDIGLYVDPRRTPSCCSASTKRARSRRLTERSPACRSRKAVLEP